MLKVSGNYLLKPDLVTVIEALGIESICGRAKSSLKSLNRGRPIKLLGVNGHAREMGDGRMV